jgi:subtilisin family serine protease
MTTVSRMPVYVCPRVRRPVFLVLLVMLLVNALAADAAAQGRRRARMSEDLAARLSRGDVAATRVIVTGTQAEVDRLARRHGLAVRKRLESGAVVEVPSGGLEALADDTDQLSSDFRVRSQMSLTAETTGASQVWEDGWAPGRRGLTGRGVGVAVIDSGVDALPELRGRVVASVDFTDDRGPGRDDYGHGTHVAGIIAAAGRNRHDDTRGMAPGANIISLKVLA